MIEEILKRFACVDAKVDALSTRGRQWPAKGEPTYHGCTPPAIDELARMLAATTVENDRLSKTIITGVETEAQAEEVAKTLDALSATRVRMARAYLYTLKHATTSTQEES